MIVGLVALGRLTIAVGEGPKGVGPGSSGRCEAEHVSFAGAGGQGADTGPTVSIAAARLDGGLMSPRVEPPSGGGSSPLVLDRYVSGEGLARLR